MKGVRKKYKGGSDIWGVVYRMGGFKPTHYGKGFYNQSLVIVFYDTI